jgi:phosphomannomutase
MNAKFKELRFGTSGLRDTVINMTDMECYINARGFIAYLEESGEFKKGDTITVGGDRRPSTYRIKRAVAAAISDMGGTVNDQGQVPSLGTLRTVQKNCQYHGYR